MANEVLARSGLFFDDLNKIRVINPQAAQTSGELKEEVGEFVTSTKISCRTRQIYSTKTKTSNFKVNLHPSPK